MQTKRYETESYDEEHEAWVLETSRTVEKVAREDVELLKSLGKRARMVGEVRPFCSPETTDFRGTYSNES